MKLPFGICYVLSILAGLASAQIGNLSTNGDGTDLYFTTDLTQRGSGQPTTNKVFLLRSGALKLIAQSSTLSGSSMYVYNRTAVSQASSVRAINRIEPCKGGSSCTRELAPTTIEIADRTVNFAGNACISSNGRFAALFGNTYPARALPSRSVRLLDLQSGDAAFIGPQAVDERQIVADDGTVLVGGDGGVRLVGPRTTVNLTPFRRMHRAVLSPDAARIVYDVNEAPPEIRVIDVASGADRSLGPGSLPMLAADGRRFSFLNINAGTPQVWVGDAVSGFSRLLSNQPEGIKDQTVSGDATRVIAATNTGRVLSIDVSSGVVTELLGEPAPRTGLLALPVPGSYNELLGSFPADYVPDVRIGTIPAIVLGRSPRGIAIQIPWEVQVGSKVTIAVPFGEPAWEQLLPATVSDAEGAALPVGAAGPVGPAYYAIHEDWAGFVSSNNPARPGEVFHMYGTGYGPVDGVVQTGRPAPPDRLFRMTSACVWRAIGVPIEVLFAGLAPGLIGIYQFDFRVPPDWPYPQFNPYCQFAGSSRFLRTAAIEVRP